jgi:hypothetical protein
MVCHVLPGHECDPNERASHHHSQLHLGTPLVFWSVLFWNPSVLVNIICVKNLISFYYLNLLQIKRSWLDGAEAKDIKEKSKPSKSKP